MKQRIYWFTAVSLVVIALLIRLFSMNSGWVEHYYSTGVYPYISICLRYVLAWMSFSFGDVLYGMLLIWILWKIFHGIGLLIKGAVTKRDLVYLAKVGLIRILAIYIVFNVLWGINYNRKGIASQLGISTASYSVDDVKTLNTLLIKKVNESKRVLMRRNEPVMANKQLFRRALLAYDSLDKQYPFLNYNHASIKPSIWGWLGNYLGFLGYYNPFTGEAQVNTLVPKFSQPYTACHEIAHQLGYAKENEANFVGYLAAVASKDTGFHYSVYLDLFLYAERNLYKADSATAKAFVNELIPEVKDDIKEWQKFHNRHKNPAEPVIRWLYGVYLESNEQPSGVLSYDEVTGFMISYYKKYGRL
ncbi:DUF3810 domain-containing protein [soil metagenome]